MKYLTFHKPACWSVKLDLPKRRRRHCVTRQTSKPESPSGPPNKLRMDLQQAREEDEAEPDLPLRREVQSRHLAHRYEQGVEVRDNVDIRAGGGQARVDPPAARQHRRVQPATALARPGGAGHQVEDHVGNAGGDHHGRASPDHEPDMDYGAEQTMIGDQECQLDQCAAYLNQDRGYAQQLGVG